MDEVQLLKRKIEREIQARKQAEKILEEKALELYEINENLEETIKRRTEQLRLSELKYRSILENMQLGLVEVDADEIIVKPYPLFCQMTGYTQEELLGKTAREILVHEDTRDFMLSQNEARKRGESSVYETIIIRKDGSEINVLISGAPIFNENKEQVGSLGVHYDITYQKELQSKLEDALEKAEAAQRAEKQFLTNISHEIRTPLNVIIGMTHLLDDTKLNEIQRGYLKTLAISSDILMALISDILDISKIDAGAIIIQEEEFDLTELVHSIKSIFQVKLDNKPIEINEEIKGDLSTYLIGDKKLLSQVLINLVGNAVKFTKEGDIIIRAIVNSVKDNIKTIRFEVKDSGIGISKLEQKEIFKQFVQANRGINRKYGGTGLGLAISQRIVSQLGGSIDVKSEEGKGSVFEFEIDFVDSFNLIEERKNLEQKIQEIKIPKDPILVVEDNLLNQKYLLTVLDKWQLPYEVANNGKEAIDQISKRSFCLVLMDIQMPILDGYGATKWIRKEDNLHREKPIIALSASTLRSDIALAKQSGFTDFLTKPFVPSQLNAVLIQFLGEKENSRDILDHDVLKDLYLGDIDYQKQMFDLFIQIVPDEFEKLKNAISEKRKTDIAAIAHKIKTNFMMVGLPKVRDLLKNIEYEAKGAGEMILINELMKEVEDILKASWHEIKKIAEQ